MNRFHSNTQLRRAIAMIELIFAIVVMSIVMLSAPMLIERSTKTTFVALQQESIAVAAAQINMIMTAEWDHNDTNLTIGEPVLTTVSTVFGQCTGGTAKPAGVTSSSGRYCFGLGGPSNTTYAASLPPLGPEGHEGIANPIYDDVDDYNGQQYTVSVYNNETYHTYEGDYIDTNLTVASTVVYGNDFTAGGYKKSMAFSNPFQDTNNTSTNIKLISVTLTSVNPSAEIADKNIRLSAFMCNIGAPKPKIISNEDTL